MITKHTPGPWKAAERTGVIRRLHNGDKTEVFLILQHNEDSWTEADANAKLVTAAPELLEALKELVSWSAHLPWAANEDLIKSREAIKKATE
jgi:hypothetical protein